MLEEIVVEADVPAEVDEATILALMEEMVAEEERKAQERQTLLDSLGQSITAKLTKRMGSRKAKESQWLEAARLYLGSLANRTYTPTEAYPFNDGGGSTVEPRRPEVNIVRVKCDAAISQTIAYQFAAGDKNWDINPPAVVDVDELDIQETTAQVGRPLRPEEVAAFRATLMSKEIEYHLTCSRYAPETRLAMKDRVILGSGIMKMPLNSGKLKKVYVKTQTLEGKTIRVPVFTLESVPEVKRINPWYFFPDDSTNDIRKCEDAIEIHMMSKTELKELKQRPDFYADVLDEVLETEPTENQVNPFNDAAFLTQGNTSFKNKYVVSEYHGPVTKKMLDTVGICGCDTDSYDEQYAEIWVINSKVVKFELSNLEGCNGIPYCLSVWEPDPATVFGFGIPMLTLF